MVYLVRRKIFFVLSMKVRVVDLVAKVVYIQKFSKDAPDEVEVAGNVDVDTRLGGAGTGGRVTMGGAGETAREGET